MHESQSMNVIDQFLTSDPKESGMLAQNQSEPELEQVVVVEDDDELNESESSVKRMLYH